MESEIKRDPSHVSFIHAINLIINMNRLANALTQARKR